MLGYVWQLLLDTSFSWIRMFAALGFSVLIGLAIGIYAAINQKAEKIVMPIVDILQTLPILAFFPFVIYVIVTALPGYIGINAAVIFLIITSMLWNIIFGVYEAVKTLPKEYEELADLYGMGIGSKLTKIYIPASMPKVMEQSTLSWAIGLFYLVTSEIFSTSNASYAVKHGIGVALTNLAVSGNFGQYAVGISIFIAFVVATRLLFFAPLERYFNRYNSQYHYNHALAAHLKSAINRVNVAHAIAMHMPHRKRIAHAPRSYYSANEANAHNSNAAKIAYAIIIAMLVYAIFSNGALANDEIIVLEALAASFARVWLAFAAIVAVSIPISVYLIFISRRSGWYVLLFQVIASIPATILLPLIVLSLRNAPMHSEIAAFTIFFLSGLWYVVFSILSQKAYISSSIFEVKKVFGVNGIRAWRKIYIYAILPGLITGAVTGIAAEWNASIVAEYFTTSAIGSGAVITSVSTGIGKLLDISLDSGNMTLMILGLLNLTAMIIIVNRLLWKRLYGKVERVYK
ncbi:MAG: ABC transporter permease subunit [Candidatus Micrarchaeia archaeon]